MTLLTQNIIVGIIILAALAWIIVKLVRARKKGSVGCSCCSLSDSCIKNKEAISPKSPCPHCCKDKKSSSHENNKNLE